MRIPISGLWTNPNDFDAPPGSTELLLNMTQDRPGIWETRRGFTALEPTPTISGPINSVTSFRGNIIVHHSTGSISRWTGTAWSTYSGTYTPPAQAAAGRVRFLTMNESLFVTTNAGVYELDSPTGAWRLTGAPKALDGTATLRRTVNETGTTDGSTTFADANGQWAYRWEWGYKNANGRVQIGAPSGRALVVNPANVVATTGNISKTSGSAVVTVINTTHGFATGEYVDVTLGGSETHFTAGTFQVTRVSATSFTYNDGGDSTFSGNPSNSITYGFSSGRAVDLAIPIPSGITTDYFVQVYRSAKSATATTEPTDQLAQVYERSPTNLEITAGSMTITDRTPDNFRDGLIDTSGETILAAKYQPPTAADAGQYHNTAFWAATVGIQTMELQLIAVGGSYGLQTAIFLAFGQGTDPTTSTWTDSIGIQTSESDGYAKLFTTGSASQNIADTARSICRAINAATNNSHVFAEYISGDQEAPGKIRIYGRTPLIGQFHARISTSVGGVQSGGAFIPNIPTYTLITDMARSGSTVTVNMAYDHSYTSGLHVQLSQSSNTTHFPNGVKTITVVDHDTFTYTESGPTVTAEANSGIFLSAPTTDVTSNIIDRTDRIAFSLPDQPWSVPLPNELFIEGAPTTTSSLPTIHRVVANRDRLYVEADSGLFEVTGFYPDFSVRTLQSPHKLLAPEAAVSQGTPGRIYGLTDQGAEEVLTSASVISTPIQDIFQDVQVNLPAALKNYGFAVAYPSDYKVLFFMPEASTDTKSTNAYVFHTRTGEWSRWDTDATCGMVDPVTDKLYLGRSDGAVWVERKTRTLADYWDPGTTQPTSIGYSAIVGTDLTVSSVAGLTVGDIIKDAGTNTRTKVTAINGLTVSVLSVTGFTAPGLFDVEHVAYTQTVRPTRFFGKEGPNIEKEIDSGMLLVQPPASSAEFTSVDVSFRNDYDPSFSAAETVALNSVVTSQIFFKVPTNMQKAGWLQAQFVHATGGERLRLLGYSLNYRGAGVKDGF